MARGWVATPVGVSGMILPAIGIANVVAVALIALRSASPLSTHASMSAAAASADLIAGIALLGGGLIATALRPSDAVGSLAILAGVAWSAPDWIGWQGAPPVVRSLAMVGAPLLGPIVLHLVAAGTGVLLRGTTMRALVVAAYAATMAVSASRALVRDPFLDPDCFAPPRNCEDNVFNLFPSQGLARQLDVALFVLAIAIGLGLVMMAAWQLLAGTGLARRAQRPLLVSGAVVGVIDAAYVFTLLVDHGETAADPTLAALFIARASAMTALAIALAWTMLRARRIGASLARLATEIRAAPTQGGLQIALATSLGDPDLTVAYRLRTTDSFVDADGMAVAGAPARPGRVATPIMRNGETIAIVVHDSGLVESDELARTIGSAARLAVDNERLHAEVQAQVRELEESRARIVETGDAARQRLERDLHDGAQQRLLALSYEVRLGLAAARREGNDERAASFERGTDEIQAVLEELRELAHGIFPAVLVEAGLGPALAGLADRSAVPVEVSGELGGRCPTASENAAYVIIDEAIRSAAGRGATHVRVELKRHDGHLSVHMTDDGVTSTGMFTHLADRAGAAGGRLVDVTDGAGLTLRLEVPCV